MVANSSPQGFIGKIMRMQSDPIFIVAHDDTGGIAADNRARFPDNLAHRSTLALALYRQKDYAAALRVYEGRQYVWPQALPGHRAVYAVVLGTAGKADAARALARGLSSGQLRVEEFELIRPLQ